jgi:RNase P subunit RPR2
MVKLDGRVHGQPELTISISSRISIVIIAHIHGIICHGCLTMLANKEKKQAKKAIR